MTTLYCYIVRELLKTLALTITALTVLFTMGGGLYNVIAFEGVSTADVLSFIPLLVPIVVTLTLPMATLFAATMVYGRLAADNELTACRAAGINIHRLFLPAVVLSVGVGIFTLLVGNFVIPGLAQKLNDFAKNSARDFVARHLEHEGFFHRPDKSGASYTVTAERVQGVTDEALRARNFETGTGLQYLLLHNPTYLQLGNDGRLVRFTSATYGLCVFDTRTSPMKVTLHVKEARDFEVGKRATYIDEQAIGPIAFPLPNTFRLSAADLRSLVHWYRRPWDSPRLGEDIQKFLVGLAQQRFYLYCNERLANGGTLSLFDGEHGREYQLTCQGTRPARNALTLEQGRVALRTPDRPLPVKYEAEQVELRARPLPSGLALVEINLIRTPRQDVLEYDPKDGHYAAPQRRPTLSLDGAQVPGEFVEAVQQISPAMVMDPGTPLAVPESLGDQRIGLQKAAAVLQRKIVGTINFRLGLTSSVFVTVLMGAALGVMFRGSRALAAFFLAMIPFFCVLILMFLGRQLAENALTTHIGPFVTWGGLLAVLLADFVILRVGVRR